MSTSCTCMTPSYDTESGKAIQPATNIEIPLTSNVEYPLFFTKIRTKIHPRDAVTTEINMYKFANESPKSIQHSDCK